MSIELNAELRNDMGKGASRRLRHVKKLPGIIYGAGKAPVNLTLEQKDMQYHLHNEAFYTQIITLNVGGSKEEVLLKDLQHNPARQDILHVDFARVEAGVYVNINVPLHFVNEEVAPGVKLEGGIISHVITDVEVECLPGVIPEFIEVDLSGLHIGDIIHLSDIKLPVGVEIMELKHGEEHDSAVAAIHARKVSVETEETEVKSVEPEAGDTED
jgi:large subunit ribosomal protein L25